MAVAFLVFRRRIFFFPCRTQRVTSADNQNLYKMRLWVMNSDAK